MKLTNTTIKNAKPKDKVYKLFDGGGLFLQVNKNGSKYWRLKYRFAGKEKLYSIGVYPNVSLKEARQSREDAKRLLDEGVDPSVHKKLSKLQNEASYANTFEAVAIQWHKRQTERWTERHAKLVLNALKRRVFPFIGSSPIELLKAPEILQVLRKMENEGIGDATYRIKNNIERVFNFAIAEGKATHNPVIGLQQALKPKPKVQHNAYLLERELPEFLNTLESYQGHAQVKLAFKLLMLTFVRTKELRLAEWKQFDFKKKQWIIPAENMKMREAHVVPLSVQAIKILKELHLINGKYDLVFAGITNPRKPMSENTLIYGLYRMGYKSRATAHGFRATASTILNENKFNGDWIERQLAHDERNEVRASYNHAEYLAERTKMMQWWADKLDTLRNQESSNLIEGHFAS